MLALAPRLKDKKMDYTSRRMLKRWSGDLEVASTILTVGFSDYPVPLSETPEDIARQILDHYISPEASWIATEGNDASGAIFGAVRTDNRARIQSMAVAPAHRRRGTGRQLLTTFLTGMDAAGVGAVHLEVIETNVAARSLYESAGFKPVRSLNCFRSASRGREPTMVGSTPAAPALRRTTFDGLPASYAARDVPLHRDFMALSAMPDVAFQRLPSGAWSASRGSVLLAAEEWADREDLRKLIWQISGGAPLKIIDVPEDDKLGEALTALGWSIYTRQIEMIRRRPA